MSIRPYFDMLIKVSDINSKDFSKITPDIGSNVRSIRGNLENIHKRSSGEFADTLAELIKLADVIVTMSTNVQNEDRLAVFMTLVSNFYLSIRKLAEIMKSKNIISDSEYNQISEGLNQIFDNMKKFAGLEFSSNFNQAWSSFLKKKDTKDSPDLVVAKIFNSLKTTLEENENLNSIYSGLVSDISGSSSFQKRKSIDRAFLGGDEFDENDLKIMFPGIDEAKPVGDTDESPDSGDSKTHIGKDKPVPAPASNTDDLTSKGVTCEFEEDDVLGFAHCISRMRRMIEIARMYARKNPYHRLYYRTYMKNVAATIQEMMDEAAAGKYGQKIKQFVETPHGSYKDSVLNLFKRFGLNGLDTSMLGFNGFDAFVFAARNGYGIMSDKIKSNDIVEYASRIIDEAATFESTLLSLASQGLLVDSKGKKISRSEMDKFLDIIQASPDMETRYQGLVNILRASASKNPSIKGKVEKLIQALGRYWWFRTYVFYDRPTRLLNKARVSTGPLWSREIVERAKKFVDNNYVPNVDTTDYDNLFTDADMEEFLEDVYEPYRSSTDPWIHLLEEGESGTGPTGQPSSYRTQQTGGYHPVLVYWAINKLSESAAGQGNPLLVSKLNEARKQLLNRYPVLTTSFGRNPTETIARIRFAKQQIMDKLNNDQTLTPAEAERFRKLLNQYNAAENALLQLSKSGIVDKISQQIGNIFSSKLLPRQQNQQLMGLISQPQQSQDPYASLFRSVPGVEYDPDAQTTSPQQPSPSPQPQPSPTPSPQPTAQTGQPVSQPSGPSLARNVSQLPDSRLNFGKNKGLRGFIDGIWS